MGTYTFDIEMKLPRTNEVVFSASTEANVVACTRSDPTFITDSGIFPPSSADGGLRGADGYFSPGASPFAGDLFTKDYTAVYALTRVEAAVYTASGEPAEAGRRIKTLVDAAKTAGIYSLVWDGKNEAGVLQQDA